jgi:hypothetical protein
VAIPFIDLSNITKWLAGSGSGTAADPYILQTSGGGGGGAVTQSGTWTVQPGNTANTTAWKVDGSAVTQPISVALPTTFYTGQTAVATAGTQQVLASSQALISGVTVKAKHTNTGYITIGTTGVNNTLTTGNGYILAAGEPHFIETDNLADVFLNATVSGDGVSYSGS